LTVSSLEGCCAATGVLPVIALSDVALSDMTLLDLDGRSWAPSK
jgi:hypothetical protein